jgi:hypothetical protein
VSKQRLRVRLEFEIEEDPTDYDFDQHPETPQQFADEMLREFNDDQDRLRDYIEDARYASGPLKLSLTVTPVTPTPSGIQRITTKTGTVYSYDAANRCLTWKDSFGVPRTYTDVEMPFPPQIGRSLIYEGMCVNRSVRTTRQTSIITKIEDTPS